MVLIHGIVEDHVWWSGKSYSDEEEMPDENERDFDQEEDAGLSSGHEDDVLVPLLLRRLPNIQTLYMVAPEYFGASLQALIEDGVFPNLDTVYLCSALREYSPRT